MAKIILYAISSIALVGCAPSIPPTLGYVHTDGSLIYSSPDTAKFETDREICRGEMAKAQLSGIVLHDKNILVDASDNLDRRLEGGQVMLGCMAARGYKVADLSKQH
jgi:hypothetical protein